MTQTNNATLVTPAATLPEAEEPPSSWRGLWSWLRHTLAGKGDSGDLREAITSLIENHDAAEDIPAAERQMLANILHLQECTAADCMLPRAAIMAVDVTTPLDELVKIMAETQHSRIPVYRETLDDILGMVHMKDVLSCLARNEACQIKDLLRQVLFIPPSTPAVRLLHQMRTSRHYMALVVDEFGGIDGIVTIEDVLEEIVGDIDDEHDEIDKPHIFTRADGSLLLEARLPIEDFEERVGEVLSEDEREEVDTVGGLVFLLAGHMPRVGESFTHSASGMCFDVLEVDHSRVLRLRVRNVPLATAPALVTAKEA